MTHHLMVDRPAVLPDVVPAERVLVRVRSREDADVDQRLLRSRAGNLETARLEFSGARGRDLQSIYGRTIFFRFFAYLALQRVQYCKSEHTCHTLGPAHLINVIHSSI